MRGQGRLDGGAPPPGRRRRGSAGSDIIGKAVIEYENGSRCEGDVVDGNPHGLGTMYRADDTIEREGNGVTASGMDWGRGTTGVAASDTRVDGAMVSGTDGGLLTTKTATRAVFSNGGAASRSIDAHPATERDGERSCRKLPWPCAVRQVQGARDNADTFVRRSRPARHRDESVASTSRCNAMNRPGIPGAVHNLARTFTLGSPTAGTCTLQEPSWRKSKPTT